MARFAGPQFWDPHQATRVRDSTLKQYLPAGRHFTEWYMRHRMQFWTPEECDDLLVEWKNAPDGLCTMSTPSPQQFVNAISFVEFCFPRWKGSLGWSHTVALAWQKATPIKHTLPCPRFLALSTGLRMAELGFPKEGAGFVLAQRKGWRPSELLRIRARDVFLPGDGWGSAVVGLGVGRGTKVRREEFSLFGVDESLELELLRRLKRKAEVESPDTPIIGVSATRYASALRNALISMGLGAVGITPHSARAGFATDLIVHGTSFTTIKESGRWGSDSSLRIYLNAIMSRKLSMDPVVQNWEPLGKKLETAFFIFYPLSL